MLFRSRLDGRSSSTLPSSSSLVPASFVRRGPLVWDQAIGKTREVLEGTQSLCAAGATETEGDEIELFSSPCQLRFILLPHIREGPNSLSCAAVSKEVCCEPPVVKVLGSGEEGSESRISRVEHGLDPIR